jgi:lysophospholipid acyltransferase (LPLAT)-like uncharacterized protein
MRSKFFHGLLTWVIYYYIRLVYMTCRWTYYGLEHRTKLIDEGKGAAIFLWHNRIAMMPFSWPMSEIPLHVLASAHRDGQIVTGAMGRFGVDTISIESRQGAVNASRKVVKLLKSGQYIGITPDGPRGPRQRVKVGTLQMARLAQVPVAMVSYATSKRKLLGSWDKFCFPLPFSKGVIIWGPSLYVPRQITAPDLEALRLDIERQMLNLNNEADRLVGQPRIEPAPIIVDGE